MASRYAPAGSGRLRSRLLITGDTHRNNFANLTINLVGVADTVSTSFLVLFGGAVVAVLSSDHQSARRTPTPRT
jgi:hypothetical protein